MRTLAQQAAAMQNARAANMQAQALRLQNANTQMTHPDILDRMRNAARDCEYCGTKRFQTEECRNCGAPS